MYERSRFPRRRPDAFVVVPVETNVTSNQILQCRYGEIYHDNTRLNSLRKTGYLESSAASHSVIESLRIAKFKRRRLFGPAREAHVWCTDIVAARFTTIY